MPRHVRVEYPGAFYHVMARGDPGEKIFLDDTDREQILRTLAQACAKTGWRIHAWVLMTNHYHWLVETPQANLVEGMRWIQNTYTRRFNHRHKLWGHVFGGRYKAVLVESDLDSDYFGNLWDYIHLNPVRASLVRSQGRGSVIGLSLEQPGAGICRWVRAPASLVCDREIFCRVWLQR